MLYQTRKRTRKWYTGDIPVSYAERLAEDAIEKNVYVKAWLLLWRGGGNYLPPGTTAVAVLESIKC